MQAPAFVYQLVTTLRKVEDPFNLKTFQTQTTLVSCFSFAIKFKLRHMIPSHQVNKNLSVDQEKK